MNSTETTERLDAAKSWENAQAYAALLGSVPSSFSSVIRTLVTDDLKDRKELSYPSASRCARLLKGSKTRSMFYFGALTFKEQQLRGRDEVTLRDLVMLFESFDIASMIAMVYLYRRVRHLCKDDDGWDGLGGSIRRFGEMGGYVGHAIPAIGLGTGMLIGAIRHIALGTLLHHDNNGFNMYVKHLEKSKLEMDLDFELKRWSCTSLQIASVVMQSVGYGVDIPKGIVSGLDPDMQIDKIIDDAPYRIKITQVWMHSLIETGEQPTIPMRGNYYPLKDEYEELKQLFNELNDSGPRFNWLEVDEQAVESATDPVLKSRTVSSSSSSDDSEGDDEAELEEEGSDGEELGEKEEQLADLERDIDALLEDAKSE